MKQEDGEETGRGEMKEVKGVREEEREKEKEELEEGGDRDSKMLDQIRFRRIRILRCLNLHIDIFI